MGGEGMGRRVGFGRLAGRRQIREEGGVPREGEKTVMGNGTE